MVVDVLGLKVLEILYSTCEVDGLSVVQVTVAPVAVIFETTTLDMVTATEAGTTFILSCLVAVCLGLDASSTLTVNVWVLAVVGVPVIIPLLVEMVVPRGSEPALIEYA